MSLADNLSADFSGDESFDLGTAFSALGEAFTDITPLTLDLDTDAIGAAGQLIDGTDPTVVGGAVDDSRRDALDRLGSLPVVGDVVGPLTAALDVAEQLTSGDSLDILPKLQAAAGDGTVNSIGSLDDTLRSVLGVAGDPAIASLVQLAGTVLPGSLDLTGVTAGFDRQSAAVRRLIDLLAAAMTIVSTVDDLVASTELTASFADLDTLTEQRNRLAGWRDARLDTQIRALADADPVVVDATLNRLQTYVGDLRVVLDSVSRGLAFGEATLVHTDLPRTAERLRTASQRLLDLDATPVRQLAEDVRQRAEPLVSLDLGSPASSLEDFFRQTDELVAPLTAKVEALDATVLTSPVTDGLAQAGDALDVVDRQVQTVLAALRAAMETVRQLVESLDLERITLAIRQLLQPVADAVAQIDALLADALSALETAAREVESALETLRSHVTGATDTVTAAFTRVRDLVAGLDLEAVVDQLRGAIGTVVEALDSVQLQPYFDSAGEVIDTTAKVVDAVPLDLLPDSTERELEEAVRPIKAIDFENDVAVVLKDELDAILDSLDTEVLGAIQAAYEDLVAFLRDIDPRELVATLEREHYDPMVERLRAVDADQLLAPFTEALERFRDTLGGLDPDALLEPIEDVFDQLLDGFDQLDPSTLLEPIEARVDALREQLVEKIGIDDWNQHLDSVAETLRGALAKIDLEALAPRLTTAYAQLLDGLTPQATTEEEENDEDGGLVGSLVATLAAGDAATPRAAAFARVRQWIGGTDGGAWVQARLRDASAAITRAREAAEQIDPQTVAGDAHAVWSTLDRAARDLPAGDVREQVLTVLGTSPIDALAPATAGKERYLVALTAATATFDELTGSGFSQVGSASAALRDALAPLDAVRQRLSSLLARFGVDTTGGDLGTIVHRALAEIDPTVVLTPFEPLTRAVVVKLDEAVVGVFEPTKALIDDIRDLIAVFDIGILREELSSVHATIRSELEELRPRVALGPLLDAFDGLRTQLIEHDPLAPIRTTLDDVQETVVAVLEAVRPSTILAPLIDAYEQVLSLAGDLDVTQLLEPVLAALRDIETQLGEGLDGTAEALGRLQEALP
ncbi:MAG: hypothetical protein AAGD38_03225 [Acidobacteriota bacterium]